MVAAAEVNVMVALGETVIVLFALTEAQLPVALVVNKSDTVPV